MLNKYHYHHVIGRGKILTGSIALALMATLLPACTNNNDTATKVGGPGPQTNVTTQEVANDTNQLIGQNVTVRSEPVKKVGPNTFTISNEQFFGGETILVVNASGAPIILPEGGTEVQVTGKVAKFVRADIERDNNWTLQPDLYVEYEGKPAIVAQSIALAPEPGTVTKNPTAFYGKNIAVAGEVEKIVGSNAFTIDEDKLVGGNDLLVLMATPKQTITEDQKVVATGVLRPFIVTEIEKDYDLTWDLDLQRKLEVEYKNKPVLITQEVFPSGTTGVQ